MRQTNWRPFELSIEGNRLKGKGMRGTPEGSKKYSLLFCRWPATPQKYSFVEGRLEEVKFSKLTENTIRWRFAMKLRILQLTALGILAISLTGCPPKKQVKTEEPKIEDQTNNPAEE